MPKGYPKNPELAHIRRSIAQKNRIRDSQWLRKVRAMLIKRNKSPEHIAKIKKANTGVKFTEERKKNLSLNHADFNGKKNPNWRGDNVGRIGVHVWLRKYFTKTNICEICKLLSPYKYGTDWALIKGKKYERKRENFFELCRACHHKYDNLGFKKGHKINVGRKQSFETIKKRFSWRKNANMPMV